MDFGALMQFASKMSPEPMPEPFAALDGGDYQQCLPRRFPSWGLALVGIGLFKTRP
jgi:hypothetical protein